MAIKGCIRTVLAKLFPVKYWSLFACTEISKL